MNQTYLKEYIKEELSGTKDYIIMEDCMHEMYNR